ncbi:MAG: polysaccharide deacetylase family protein [Anaerolineae bacterium]
MTNTHDERPGIVALSRAGLPAVLIVILLTGCAVPHTPEATAPPVSTVMPTTTLWLVETPDLTATPAPVSFLTWETLRNTGYPNEWPSEGIAQLEDGEYRERYMPDSASEMVINLAPYRLFGELNGDGIEDAAVILIAAPGGSGTFYYLAAVLNQDGQPRPLGSQFLGDRVFIRGLSIDEGLIWIDLDVAGPDDPMYCPTDHKRQAYAVEGEKLVLVDEEDLPDPEVSARLKVPQQRIQFEPGVTSATYQEDITANHTLDHRSLSGIGREAFFHEVADTQEILGDRGAHCLRPPYGAIDSYTRARAAELGYTVVMWNIDTGDWRRPAPEVFASEVLDKAFPGAVVLMHDGGGDRSQTVEALKTILGRLSDQGYRFEAICRE